MKNIETFPLVDFIPFDDYRHLGFEIPLPTNPFIRIRAVKSASFRTPKAGEWYLSGATPEAYKAKNDLTTKYWMVRLVLCKLEPAKWVVDKSR